MKPSVKAFLQGIIDYAGLFPPAGLSLDTSIHKYNDYRNTEDAWMLSRFIIPASRLPELEAYAETLLGQNKPFDFSVLGKGTETAAGFSKELQDIVDQVRQFHTTHGRQVTSDILEMKLPREVVLGHDKDLLLNVFEETAGQLNSAENLPKAVFFEAYLEESWKNDIQHVLQMLHRYNDRHSSRSGPSFGFKVRCGGVKASLFPSPEQLAYILNLAGEYEIPLKCTAGLHHPVRHYADSVNTKMHGFLNVFGGAMLHYEHDLPEEELLQVLKEEDPEHFEFSEDRFRWGDKSVSTETIQYLRENKLISFGSCSFVEPREDLRELELL